MTDFASLGIEIDSRPVRDGKAALDDFADAAANVEQRVRVSNGQMANTSKIMQAQASQSRANTDANKALGTSVDALTTGQSYFIDKLKDQVAVLGMSRSQLAAYQAAQLGVTQQTQDLIDKLKAFEDEARSAADAQAQAAARSTQWSDALKFLAAGYAALQIADYIKDATLLAARYETLGVVSQVVGATAGYTVVQMNAATDAIARQGITLVESRQSAVKLVQAHVDLANATNLARIAQDAAVIGNISSSAAFDRLVDGIGRGNTLILRNIGLNVNFEDAYRKAAEAIGTTTAGLSENERVNARVSAVIEHGTDIAGAYAASMDTVGKQLKSAERYTEDFKTTFGETFNEVLSVAVMAWTDHLKDASGEIKELAKNNELQAWGHDLAAIFVGVANAIDNVLTGAKMAGTFAGHQAAGASINAKYDQIQATAPKEANSTDSLAAYNAIEAQRKAAFAKEQADYEESQVTLAGTVDRFQRAFDERTAAQLQKHKAAADAALKIDQDYAAKATALRIANADKSAAEQQAAQTALAKSVYVGTPNYRDTPGKPATAKVDQAANTELQDQLKRYDDEAAAAKKHNADLSTLDDMYRKAGELSDDDFYNNKRKYSADTAAAQIAAYDKEIDALAAHDNATVAEEARTQKQIDDIDAKRATAQAANSAESFRLDEEERLRQKAIADASDDAVNKYISGLNQEAQKQEESNSSKETSRGAIERLTAARLDEAAATTTQTIAAAAENGESESAIEFYQKTLVALNNEADAHRRVAAAMDQKDVIAANAMAAKAASTAWDSTAKHVEDTLADAIANGGDKAWKKLKTSIVSQVLSIPINFVGSLAASILNPTAAQAVGAATSGTGDVGSLIGAANAASTAYKVATGGVAATVGGGISSFGSALGSSTIAEFGSGVSGSATAAATALGGELTSAASAGAAFTSALSTAVPWIAGAVVAYKVLDGIFSDGPESDTRLTFASNNTAGNVSVNERGNEGQDESYIGGSGASSFGTFGVSSSFWTDTNSAAVQALIKNVATTDDALATYLTADEKTAVTTALTDHTDTVHTGAEGSDQNASGQLDSVFSDRINTILNAVEPGLGALEAGFTGTSEQLATEAEALLSYRDSLKDSGVAIFGAQVTLEQIAALKTPTEATSAALTRVTNEFTATNAVAAAMGKDASTAFGAVGLASEAARAQLIQLAGGVDTLTSETASYSQNYLSSAEQLAPTLKAVTAAMDAMGLSGVTTRAQFKDVVDSLDLSTTAGATEYAQLMALSDAFASVHDATVDATKSEADIASERADLQSQLDKMTLTSTQLLAQQRDALDASNQALFDQVQAAQALVDAQSAASDARSALSDAYNNEAQSMQSVIDAKKADAAATLQQIDALKLGSDSILSPEQQLAESKRQFDTATGADKDSAATTYLDAAKNYYGSSQDYATAYNQVQTALKASAAASTSAASNEQQQLDAMTASVSVLTSINAGVLSVQQAIANLNKANVAATTPSGVGPNDIENLYETLLNRQGEAAGLQYWQTLANAGETLAQITAQFVASPEYATVHGSHANGLDFVPFDGYRAELHHGERVQTAAQARGSDDSATQSKAQTAAILRQNDLIEKQNTLLEGLSGKVASSDDIRSLKQHMATTLSRKAVPA
jgi:hypothetical protein